MSVSGTQGSPLFLGICACVQYNLLTLQRVLGLVRKPTTRRHRCVNCYAIFRSNTDEALQCMTPIYRCPSPLSVNGSVNGVLSYLFVDKRVVSGSIHQTIVQSSKIPPLLIFFSLAPSLFLFPLFFFSLLLLFKPLANHTLFPLSLSTSSGPRTTTHTHPGKKKDDHPINGPRPVPTRVPRPPRNNRMEPERPSHRSDGHPAFAYRGGAGRIALIAVSKERTSEKQ